MDAFFEQARLVVEYKERQHVQAMPFFDRRPTISGVPRGLQRAKYDKRRRSVLLAKGVRLGDITFPDFRHDATCLMLRSPSRDRTIVDARLRDTLR